MGRGVGDLGLAGVTVSTPVITTFMAFIMLIGMGATTLISIRLGENKKDDAEKILANALIMFLILGIGLTIIGQVFLEPIVMFFGGDGNTLPYALYYMRVLLLGTTFLALGTGMNNFIRAEGNAKKAMFTMLIGAVVNIILDYIFIFIFNWGIKGAAFATVLSYIVSSVFVLLHFFGKDSTLKIRKENFKLNTSTILIIMTMGFPSFILQVTNSLQQMILNRKLYFYGGDTALTVIGIIMSTATFLIMPAMGISQGAQPIIGFNYGAKKYERVKDTLKLSILASTVIVSIGFGVSYILPEQIIGFFNASPEVVAMGIDAMAIFLKFVPLVGVQMMSSSYFQAVGKPNQATLLGLSRQIIIFIPLLLWFANTGGLNGIWWSTAYSDILAFFFTGAWLLLEIRNLNKEEQSTYNELQKA